LLIVSLAAAWLLHRLDLRSLIQMDSMSPELYVLKRRAAMQHSYFFGFAAVLILGGFYLGLVGFISYLVRLAWPKAGSL
jgi:hypothetical protein